MRNRMLDESHSATLRWLRVATVTAVVGILLFASSVSFLVIWIADRTDPPAILTGLGILTALGMGVACSVPTLLALELMSRPQGPSATPSAAETSAGLVHDRGFGSNAVPIVVDVTIRLDGAAVGAQPVQAAPTPAPEPAPLSDGPPRLGFMGRLFSRTERTGFR